MHKASFSHDTTHFFHSCFPESKDDPVSKMIEKIALSKNPVEATVTMVAALATSSRLGNQNQRKLLLELTKKVRFLLFSRIFSNTLNM